MATPVVESSTSTNFAASTTTTTITKPAGLAVGELLVAAIQFADAGSATAVSAPAGWTTLETVDMTDGLRRLTVFYIIATSTETAASNFTFTASNTCTIGGGMLRISGVAPGSEIQTSEQDVFSGASTTSISFTSTLTPNHTDNLILLILCARSGTAGAASISSYTSTPSKTWTEIFDIGNTAGSDLVLAVASATSGVTTQITNYGATLSLPKTPHAGVILSVNPPINASGSNTALEVSPTFFSQTGSSGVNGSNTLLEIDPTLPIQSGSATAPTQWINEPSPSTTWINEEI